MRIGLNEIAARHSQKIAANIGGVVRGGDAGKKLAADVNATQGEQLNVSVGGTAYPVFVLSVHDIDDPIVSRYVP